MIEINEELLKQIDRSADKNPEYMPNLLKTLDSNVKDEIYTLLESAREVASLEENST